MHNLVSTHRSFSFSEKEAEWEEPRMSTAKISVVKATDFAAVVHIFETFFWKELER